MTGHDDTSAGDRVAAEHDERAPRCTRCALAAGAGTLLASRLLQRLSVRTGATDEEVHATLPGDELLPHPMLEWTRAVTVRATPSQIWPWLVQRGYGRAGWYTPRRVDDIFEPLVFRTRITHRPPDRELRPDLQDLEVGDIVADGPEHGAYFRVVAMDEPHAIVYHSIRHPWRAHPVDPSDPAALTRLEQRLRDAGVYLDFTWAFVIRPQDDGTSRLLVRTRSDYAPRALGLVTPLAGLFDATYGVAMLWATATRAEGSG